MDVGVSYRNDRPEGRYDAIVVGSGMGGLSTALGPGALYAVMRRRVAS
jgi:hypothetical protein